MSSYNKVISIHGVPRSGTSWLGQIFNSHSDVAYRFQPLFSYRFKDKITLDSSLDEVNHFFDEVYKISDDIFLSGNWKENIDPIKISHKKNRPPESLVMKMVRYHFLIEKFLKANESVKIIGIVRNPCAVINSWLKAPKEFQNNWDALAEWRYAPSKNLGRIEEYNGFEKWKEVALSFLRIQSMYSERFYLVQYEFLVESPLEIIEEVFSFSGLSLQSQVVDFIKSSQNVHVEDAYSVYKSPEVKDKWRSELDSRIINEIIKDLQGTRLEQFLI